MGVHSGKWLEELVANVEKLFLSKDFKVSIGKTKFNDEGVQTVEYDIVIEGKVGTTDIKWLIECRDRPSKGSAPLEWIEQLGSRKQLGKFSKVSAVSTSGFSPAAMEAAKVLDIELRDVETRNPETLLDWLNFTKISFLVRKGILTSAEIRIETNGPKQLEEAFLTEYSSIPNDKKFLFGPENKLTISELWNAIFHSQSQLGENLTPGQTVKGFKVLANFPDEETQYMVQTTKGIVRIAQILFVVDLSVSITELPISQVRAYSRDQNELIAQIVEFEPIMVEGKVVNVAVHKIERDGENTFLSIQIG
jgi:hypothetical protein